MCVDWLLLHCAVRIDCKVNVKSNLRFLTHYAQNTYGEQDLHSCTYAYVGDRWTWIVSFSASRPVSSILKEIFPNFIWLLGSVVPRSGMDDVNKRKSSAPAADLIYAIVLLPIVSFGCETLSVSVTGLLTELEKLTFARKKSK